MKKSLRIALVAMALLAGVGQRALAQNIYYWYGAGTAGGSGNWNTPSHWRILRPEAPTTSPVSITTLPTEVATTPPTAGDDVVFGPLSPFTATPASRTVTISAAATARTINWTGARNSPIFQVNGPLTIAGSLTFIANMSVTATSGGSVTFTAPGQATITSAGKTFSMPVTFEGPAGSTQSRWVLQDNMTIGNRVTFVNGYVEAPVYATNANASRTLILTQSAAAPVGASDNSHVIGYVQKLQLNGVIEMPVGAGIVNDVKLFRPVIATASAANNVTAKYFNANPKADLDANIPANSGLTDISDREYWFITSNSSNGLRISLSYNRPNFPTSIESPSSSQYYFMDDPRRRNMLTVAGWRSGAGWSNRNGNDPPQINAETRIITGTGSLSNNEFFTIASRGVAPLPVKLVSFSAQYVDGQVQLKWQSAEEKNTSHFEIEKSADGKHFSALLTKKAQGNSAALVSYNALDNSPLNGTSYYRLKMVDLDGTFEYSKMVAVSAESELLVRAYPNPCQGNNIHFVAGNGSKLVLKSVSDLFGKQMGYRAANAPEGLQVSFPQSLPAGFYVATLAGVDNGQLVKVKFIVQ